MFCFVIENLRFFVRYERNIMGTGVCCQRRHPQHLRQPTPLQQSVKSESLPESTTQVTVTVNKFMHDQKQKELAAIIQHNEQHKYDGIKPISPSSNLDHSLVRNQSDTATTTDEMNKTSTVSSKTSEIPHAVAEGIEVPIQNQEPRDSNTNTSNVTNLTPIDDNNNNNDLINLNEMATIHINQTNPSDYNHDNDDNEQIQPLQPSNISTTFEDNQTNQKYQTHPSRHANLSNGSSTYDKLEKIATSLLNNDSMDPNDLDTPMISNDADTPIIANDADTPIISKPPLTLQITDPQGAVSVKNPKLAGLSEAAELDFGFSHESLTTTWTERQQYKYSVSFIPRTDKTKTEFRIKSYDQARRISTSWSAQGHTNSLYDDESSKEPIDLPLDCNWDPEAWRGQTFYWGSFRFKKYWNCKGYFRILGWKEDENKPVKDQETKPEVKSTTNVDKISTEHLRIFLYFVHNPKIKTYLGYRPRQQWNEKHIIYIDSQKYTLQFFNGYVVFVSVFTVNRPFT